jgi:triphosphoribosyl-dephospho-CoA synthase
VPRDVCHTLADLAVAALLDEALLTPKPGLVDRRGSGAHTDLSLDLMLRSARSLHPTFVALAGVARGRQIDQVLREDLATIGREGEAAMYCATAGVNTHRGALWALGLLVAAVALADSAGSATQIAARAGAIARYPDRRAPPAAHSHGAAMRARHGVGGAPGEAAEGFPHVIEGGLPALRRARARGVPEPLAQLDALCAIMADLDDTCLLYRGGPAALALARDSAREILASGGVATRAGYAVLCRLDCALLACHASPGGSADLLAATLFLDRVEHSADAREVLDGEIVL